MTSDSVIACIELYLADQIGSPVPERDENLFLSGAVDSMCIMRLIAHLEKTYSLTIPQGDLIPDHFKTILAMADYLSTTFPAE